MPHTPSKFIVHCRDCDKTWDYTLEPNQSLYGAAYLIAARHERENLGRNCWLSAMRYIQLVGVEYMADESAGCGRSPYKGDQ